MIFFTFSTFIFSFVWFALQIYQNKLAVLLLVFSCQADILFCLSIYSCLSFACLPTWSECWVWQAAALLTGQLGALTVCQPWKSVAGISKSKSIAQYQLSLWLRPCPVIWQVRVNLMFLALQWTASILCIGDILGCKDTSFGWDFPSSYWCRAFFKNHPKSLQCEKLI